MALWRKRNAITGVSASTMVGLNAVVLEAEQDTKRLTGKQAKIGTAKSKLEESQYIGVGIAKGKPLSLNKGVQSRAERDALDYSEEGEPSLQKVDQRLREKEELYNRMQRGESLDPNTLSTARYDDDGPMVDFEQKQYDDRDTHPRYSLETNRSRVSMVSADMSIEEDRRTWEEEADRERMAEEAKRERIRMASIIEAETIQGRRATENQKDTKKREKENRLAMIQKRRTKGKGQEVKDKRKEEEEVPRIETNEIDDFLSLMRKGVETVNEESL
ncbi:hypothetical protein PROFUN_06840 [Planoprotostelium fungivorum]|uniref:Uncharacterized protein n=1 Tax=Planoprotostelium fungivorum TaxID=1890364 RepID=A0A2P6NND6_9EUKA|nr:hypothetical protein PROFUN_06840 [Planoprotostelium fungivorum]